MPRGDDQESGAVTVFDFNPPTPPALKSFLNQEKSSFLASDDTKKVSNFIKKQSVVCESDATEWMILPRNRSHQTELVQSAVIDSDLKVTSKEERNCMVSPIYLKKKSRSGCNSSNNKAMAQLSAEAEQYTAGDCDYGQLNSELYKLSTCKVVISRVENLDKMARNSLESQIEEDLIEKMPPLSIHVTPRNGTPSGCSAAKETVMRSAKKRLDLTSSPVIKKAIKHSFLTSKALEKSEKDVNITEMTEFECIRLKLQASAVPDSLPCRGDEFNDIKTFILRKIQDASGGCMYISGVPGTGKTATVHAVVKSLQEHSQDDLPSFDFVEINGLRLTEPRQSYVRIWQNLAGEKLHLEQALNNLEKKFSGRPARTTVILLDELDYLCNKRQDVIYNLLEWTTFKHSKLVLLTIANTMDLPERTLKGKVTSRMGLTRLVFQPYTHKQLQEIVINRLGDCRNLFDPDAVQLVARKVAAISGDARRALDICRRAIETLACDSSKTINVFEIDRVMNSIFTGTRVQAIKNASRMCQLVLRAIRDDVSRTGVEETTFSSVYNHLVTICTLEGETTPSSGEVSKLINILADCGLLVAEMNRSDLRRKVCLNISPDDIHYALSGK